MLPSFSACLLLYLSTLYTSWCNECNDMCTTEGQACSGLYGGNCCTGLGCLNETHSKYIAYEEDCSYDDQNCCYGYRCKSKKKCCSCTVGSKCKQDSDCERLGCNNLTWFHGVCSVSSCSYTDLSTNSDCCEGLVCNKDKMRTAHAYDLTPIVIHHSRIATVVTGAVTRVKNVSSVLAIAVRVIRIVSLVMQGAATI